MTHGIFPSSPFDFSRTPAGRLGSMSETAARPKPLKTINMALTRSTLDTMPEKAQHRLLAYEVNEGQVPPERGVTKKNID